MNQGSPPTDRAAAAADPPAAVGQTSSASTDQFDPGEHDASIDRIVRAEYALLGHQHAP